MSGKNCYRCAVERQGGFGWTSEAHAMDCPNADGRATKLVRDANNGGGPLSVMTFVDLADLVSLFAPCNPEARDSFFAALKARTEHRHKR
jgi:hypothetical protein